MINLLFFFWLAAISFGLWYIYIGYRKFTGYGKHAQLRELLESMLAKQDHLVKKSHELEEIAQHLVQDGGFHLQKIGMVRFNPFADTGGAQSFSLAILDGQNNGIVMTSLYGRNSNRWYVKEIVKSKGKDFELSKEEKDAIQKAHE